MNYIVFPGRVIVQTQESIPALSSDLLVDSDLQCFASIVAGVIVAAGKQDIPDFGEEFPETFDAPAIPVGGEAMLKAASMIFNRGKSLDAVPVKVGDTVLFFPEACRLIPNDRKWLYLLRYDAIAAKLEEDT